MDKFWVVGGACRQEEAILLQAKKILLFSELFLLPSQSLLEHYQALPPVVILELYFLNFTQFSGSFLDDLPLLTDTEPLQVVEADPKLLVHVCREPSTRLEIVLSDLMVPVLLVRLLLDRQRSHSL